MSIPQPGTPLIIVFLPSSASYAANTGLFSIDAAPLVVDLGDGKSYRDLSGTPSIQIRVQLDSTGNLVGGMGGDDLIVTGDINDTYNGDLLRGEILSFAYLNDPSDTDTVEMRFHVTGGTLANHPGFAGQDIGLIANMESVRTPGGAVITTPDFTQDFNVLAVKGSLGPIPE